MDFAFIFLLIPLYFWSNFIIIFSYLLTKGAVAAFPSAVQLKRLPQQRVEGLSRAVDGGGVGGHAEGRHVAHLLQRAVALGGLVQQLVIFKVLRQTLQHGNWLVEVHLKSRKKKKRHVHPRSSAFCGRDAVKLKTRGSDI